MSEELRAALARIRRAYERGADRDDLVRLIDAALAAPDRADLRTEFDNLEAEVAAESDETLLSDAEVQTIYAAFDKVNATEARTVEGRRAIVTPLYRAVIQARIDTARARATPDRADPLDEDATREAVVDSTNALIIAFRRYCIDRWGEAPSEDDYRAMLGVAAALATPDRADLRARSWNCENDNHDDCAAMVEQDAEGVGITDCRCSCHATPDRTDLRDIILNGGLRLPGFDHWRTRSSSKPSDPDDVRWECSCGYAGSPETVQRHWAVMFATDDE